MASESPFVKEKVGARPARAALLAALVFLTAPVGAEASAAAGDAFDTRAYARVLENFVTPEGKVRYAALKQNQDDLNAYLKELAAASPENRPELFPTPAAQMAYWINAYNAFVLHAVVEAYPVSSVRDLKLGFGVLFFKRARFVAGGKTYSLDDIEHAILRRQFADPRLHFAISCASASCPPLPQEPFEAVRLEAQLEQAARQFIGKEENVWMRGDVLFLSKIFDWYGEDFLKALKREGARMPSLSDYVARYLPEPVADQVRRQKPRVEFYGYDWSLNDASARAD